MKTRVNARSLFALSLWKTLAAPINNASVFIKKALAVLWFEFFGSFSVIISERWRPFFTASIVTRSDTVSALFFLLSCLHTKEVGCCRRVINAYYVNGAWLSCLSLRWAFLFVHLFLESDLKNWRKKKPAQIYSPFVTIVFAASNFSVRVLYFLQ